MREVADRNVTPEPGSELSLLVGPGSRDPEELILIARPTADGRVHTRVWNANDWSASPLERDRDAGELLADIERAVRIGRSLNQELSLVRGWLEPVRGDRAR
jgi:hypothetical protein